MRKAGRPTSTFLFFGLVFFLLNGCSWFDLRDPEPPSLNRSSFEEPLVPEVVPENIRFAFSDANPENFRKCLGTNNNPEDYQFVPSPEFQSQIPFYSRDEEVTGFNNLMLDLLPEEKMTVEFLQPLLVNQIDSAEWSADYRLLIPRSSSDYPSFIDGKIILNLKKDANGLWYVFRWRDFSVLGNYCWSQLKRRFIG